MILPCGSALVDCWMALLAASHGPGPSGSDPAYHQSETDLGHVSVTLQHEQPFQQGPNSIQALIEASLI